MNRRSFMKKVGGALAGVVALGLPSTTKAEVVKQGKWIQECQSVEVDEFTTYIKGDGFTYCFNRPLSNTERMMLLREPFAMFKKPIEPKLNENHPLARRLVSHELFTRT